MNINKKATSIKEFMKKHEKKVDFLVTFIVLVLIQKINEDYDLGLLKYMIITVPALLAASSLTFYFLDNQHNVCNKKSLLFNYILPLLIFSIMSFYAAIFILNNSGIIVIVIYSLIGIFHFIDFIKYLKQYLNINAINDKAD